MPLMLVRLWRAKEVPLSSSIPALCWLDSSMLAVALTQTKSVTWTEVCVVESLVHVVARHGCK